MNRREFDLFRNVPTDYINYTRQLYNIARSDQDVCLYAFVDIRPDDATLPTLPTQPELMMVDEVDFGKVISTLEIAMDFQAPDSDPDAPLAPEGGAYATVNIANALAASSGGLQTTVEELMRDQTIDPLSSHYGDIGVRAGGLSQGQKDAYVWTAAPFTNSVALTIAFPSQYNSVCVVRGQKREASNGKAGMAQIVDPEVVLMIEGKNLIDLQRVYQDLYHVPYFALTEEQRRKRDVLFNDHLAQLISNEASKNRATEQARQASERHRQQPQLREREIPRS